MNWSERNTPEERISLGLISECQPQSGLIWKFHFFCDKLNYLLASFIVSLYYILGIFPFSERNVRDER